MDIRDQNETIAWNFSMGYFSVPVNSQKMIKEVQLESLTHLLTSYLTCIVLNFVYYRLYQLPTTKLPTTDYQLPTTNYRLQTTNYQLPTTNYQLPLSSPTLQFSYVHSIQRVNWGFVGGWLGVQRVRAQPTPNQPPLSPLWTPSEPST